jgi:hypothetical protein
MADCTASEESAAVIEKRLTMSKPGSETIPLEIDNTSVNRRVIRIELQRVTWPT